MENRKILVSAVIPLMLLAASLTTSTTNAQAPQTDWEKTFGGGRWDEAWSVQQTSDGGYIIAGCTFSFGAGSADVYLIKTDAGGELQWDKTFGGSDWDEAWSVQQTSDGGYIIAGLTESFGAGGNDVYLIKTDAGGELQWDKTFGGSGSDYAFSVQQTSDGGYIIAGDTYSFGAGGNDVYLIKVKPSYSQEKYDELLEKYDELLADYDSLARDYADLESRYADMQEKYDEFLADYDSLARDYADLESRYADTMVLIYALAITTIVFMATTIYFARRKP